MEVMSAVRRTRDEVIALGCQLGQAEAFRELVRLMESKLFYYVRKFVGDDETALDVLQDVWMTVFRKIRKLRDPARLRSWIYRIAHDRAVSRFYKDLKEPAFNGAKLTETAAGAEEPDWGALDAVAVHAALDRVSPVHREVLILRFMGEMTYEEIAHATGVSVGLVKSRMHYAKRSLRVQLESASGGAP